MNIFVRKNDNDLLKYLNTDEMTKVQPFQSILEYNDDEIIFSINDKGRDIYLVIVGSLELWVQKNENEKITIDTIYEGEFVGELNFAINLRRHMNLSTKGKTRLIKYPYSQLSKLMKKEPQIAAKIHAAINDSMADKNIRITQRL
ncbi:MAG: cyclic nucleotide-binding domain-containing protein [Candidatus Cloacimonetes bacterium]|nr:cyclic nucleotide-binding domain-containing protein [Candidatus Cloacimonadota bacterium]